MPSHPLYAKLPDQLFWYAAVDFAIGEKQTNDYTVILPFAVDADSNMYIGNDVVRARMDAQQIVEQIVDMMIRRKPLYVALERGHISKTIGPALNKRMRERGVYSTLWEGTPTTDKVARCRSFQARMQQGKVFFPHNTFTTEILIPELLSFPAGKHDDIVDALSWSCLMLDDIVQPAHLIPVPDNSLVKDSYDWMKQRTTKPEQERNRALVEPLFKPRKDRNKKDKPLRLRSL